MFFVTLCFRKQYLRSKSKIDLRSKFKDIPTQSHGLFEKTFLNVLECHAIEKKKSIQANHKPYVTKAMRNAIMKRSELATKFRAEPTDFNKKAFKKQKNFCKRLYKKEREKYY